MENIAENDHFKLFFASAKGVQIIRTGLRNIATTSEKNQLLSEYHAPVSAKYDISRQSRTPYEPRTHVAVLGMGHGFGKTLIQNPGPEILSQITGIHVQCQTEENSSVRCSDCARIISVSDNVKSNKLFDATVNKPAKCVFTKKILPVPPCGVRNLFATIDTKSKTFSNGGKLRKKSFSPTCAVDNGVNCSLFARTHSPQALRNVSLTSKCHIPQDEKTTDAHVLKSNLPIEGVDFSHTGQNSKYFNSDTENSAVLNDPNPVPKTLSPLGEQGSSIHDGRCVSSSEPKLETYQSLKSEEMVTEAKKSANPGFNESFVSPILYTEAVVCPDEQKSEHRSAPVVSSTTLKGQDGTCTSQQVVMDTDHPDTERVPLNSEASQQNLGNEEKQENVHSENRMSGPMDGRWNYDTYEFSSPDETTGKFESPPSNRKRRRPCRSRINTDKKMWMSKKSAVGQDVQNRENQGLSEQEFDIPGQSASPVDMLVRAFGYDPSDDAFSNTTTNACVPLSLNDIRVPVFNKQQIKFDKNLEDECVIAHQGSSSALYLASRNGKHVFVKDSSQSYLSAETILREAKVLSILNGTPVAPHLHGVLEQGILNDEYCVVQGNCDGFLSLTQLLQSGYYLSRSDWMRITLTLVSHVKILHNHRVLHNNICSDNILVNKDSLEVKLVGFGQASYRRGVKLSRTVRQGQHLSPEVKYGCVTSPQSDVYALGSILEQIMVESRIMALYEVVVRSHKNLPRDRPQVDQIYSIVSDI